VSFLNYHHLRYFHAIAREGNLTRAAESLHVSQSALSMQLKKLEESLGQPLFDREHKTLVLTEAGHVALAYAESIFQSGAELVDTLAHRHQHRRRVLRVGSVATLSRNFQIEFLRPIIGRPDAEVVVRSAPLRDLLGQLRAHTIDIVLANSPVPRDAQTPWHSRLIADQPVSLVGRKPKSRRRFRFPDDLRDTPIILPSLESNVRAGFDALLAQAGIRPLIAAEVDDMAMLRLLARESPALALALVPRVVVQDELRDKILVERHRFTELHERFYAITPERRYPNPLVAELMNRTLQK
jgi:LysR family transcriptional activator of nhaA